MSKGDQLRIDIPGVSKEISIPVTKMFDYNGNEIESAERCAVTYCDYYVKAGAKVYKTKDAEFVKRVENDCQALEYRKLPLDIEVVARVGAPLAIKMRYRDFEVAATGSFLVEKSKSAPISDENIAKQLGKLSDTPYALGKLTLEREANIFFPLKELNELRRAAIENLNQKRLMRASLPGKEFPIVPTPCAAHEPELTVEVASQEQYEAARELGIRHIYFSNIVRRNNSSYLDFAGEVLVGGLGGLYRYAGRNPVVTDYSFNVVNAKSVALLSSLGAERVTLSQEISRESIASLVDSYLASYGAYPNLELIVYGRAKVMHSRYCPLKRLGRCGECRNGHFALQDDYASFPLLFNSDCTTFVYNSKILNAIDDLNSLRGVNFLRLCFSTESPAQMRRVIAGYQEKIATGFSSLHFDKATDTHGHLLKDPL